MKQGAQRRPLRAAPSSSSRPKSHNITQNNRHISTSAAIPRNKGHKSDIAPQPHISRSSVSKLANTRSLSSIPEPNDQEQTNKSQDLDLDAVMDIMSSRDGSLDTLLNQFMTKNKIPLKPLHSQFDAVSSSIDTSKRTSSSSQRMSPTSPRSPSYSPSVSESRPIEDSIESTERFLRPLRNSIPHDVQLSLDTMVHEATRRRIDQKGRVRDDADTTIPVDIPDNHDPSALVFYRGQHVPLSSIGNTELAAEILTTVMQWNRSSSRTTPYPMDDLRMENTTKITEGVSSFFSADHSQGGRSTTYDQILREIQQEHSLKKRLEQEEKQKKQKQHEENESKSNDEVISEPYHRSTTTNEPNTDVHDMTLHSDQNKSSSPVVHNPNKAQFPLQSTILKNASPYVDIQRKPADFTKHTESLPITIEQLEDKTRYHMALSDTILRRKPRGKLSDIEIRDMLVDHLRLMPLDKLMEKYNISLLSFYEDLHAQSPLHNIAQTVGAYTPQTIRLPADKTSDWIILANALQIEQQRLKKMRKIHIENEMNLGLQANDELSMLLGNIPSSTGSSSSSSLTEQQRELYTKELDELEQAMTDHQHMVERLQKTTDGYYHLDKDDILIPNVPDSILRAFYSALLESQQTGEDGQSFYKDYDEQTRESFISGILAIKGKTVSELFKSGIFDTTPYQGVSHENIYDPTRGQTNDDGAIRSRYGFNDESVYLYRHDTPDEHDSYITGAFGGSEGMLRRRRYHNSAKRDKDSFIQNHTRPDGSLDIDYATFDINQFAMGDGRLSLPDGHHRKDERVQVERVAYRGTNMEQEIEFGKGYTAHRQVGPSEALRQPASRFVQEQIAASIISKYGSFDSSYRSSLGYTTDTVSDTIRSALADCNVKFDKETESADIAALKMEALQYPKKALEALLEHVHVPYMHLTRLTRSPSRFLGTRERHLTAEQVYDYGVHPHIHVVPLGPYHPLFLVTLGSQGFMRESQMDVGQLKGLLGGSIDDKIEAEQAQLNGISPLKGTTYPHTRRRIRFTRSELDQAFGDDPDDTFDYADNESGMSRTRVVRPSKQRQNIQSIPSSPHSHIMNDGTIHPAPSTATAPTDTTKTDSFIDHTILPTHSQRTITSVDDIAEVMSSDDDNDTHHHHHQQQQQHASSSSSSTTSKKFSKSTIDPSALNVNGVEHQQKHDVPGFRVLPDEGEYFSQLSTEKAPDDLDSIQLYDPSLDPNQIAFNTVSNVEYHDKLDEYHIDIGRISEEQLQEGLKAYELYRQSTLQPGNEDVMSLKHYLRTHYKQYKDANTHKIHADIKGIDVNAYNGEYIPDAIYDDNLDNNTSSSSYEEKQQLLRKRKIIPVGSDDLIEKKEEIYAQARQDIYSGKIKLKPGEYINDAILRPKDLYGGPIRVNDYLGQIQHAVDSVPSSSSSAAAAATSSINNDKPSRTNNRH